MRKMTLASLAGFLAMALASGPACQTGPKSDYRVKAVPFTSVHFTDGFWATRQQADIAVTISHEMKETEKTGRIKNFELAAAALAGATDGKLATRYSFDDSDVYKLI